LTLFSITETFSILFFNFWQKNVDLMVESPFAPVELVKSFVINQKDLKEIVKKKFLRFQTVTPYF